MLNFIRKIRKSMLSEGQTGKYLKYAIGEIFLVVIGILIALQVNNWNKRNLDARAEQEVLVDLNTEIRSNITSLEMIIKEHEKSLAAGEEIKTLIIDPGKGEATSDDSLRTLVKTMNYNWTYDPKLGILNSVINSGRINLIQNKEIRYMLSSVNEFIFDANETTDEIGKLRNEYYWPMIAAKQEVTDFSTLTFEHKSLLQNSEFVWWVRFCTVVRKEGLDEEYELLAFLNDLSERIEAETEL